MGRLHRSTTVCLAGLGLLLYLSACQNPTPPDPVSQTKVEGGATLSKVTLKQANNKGQLLWELQAKSVTYGEDLNIAQVKGLQGQLYDQGRPIYKIQAQKGTVEQAGQLVILKGNTVATDVRNRVVLKAPQLRWQGEQGILQVPTGFTLTHPQVKIQGRWLEAFTRSKQVNVRDNVVAITQPQQFRLRTDRLQWQVDQEILRAGNSQSTSKQPNVTIDDQLKQAGKQQAGNRAVAGAVRLNLKQQILTLQYPAQVTLVNPLLEITSRQLVWDLKHQILKSDQLLEVNHRQENVKILANQGRYDQRQQRVQFNGQVEAKGERNQSWLTANTLTWQLNQQRIDARGNVRYQQGSPEFQVQGPQAVGKIQEQMIQISGGDVVTEIGLTQ